MSSEHDDLERESVLSGLESRDDEVRRLAVERLLVLPASDAIPRLIESLGDSCWRVRKAGVQRLAACRDEEGVDQALITALADGENPGRRNSAVEALVASGERVLGRLITALDSDDVDVRKLVVDTIAGIGSDRGRDAMIGSLSDADPNVRAAAADALAAIGGEGVERALRDAIQHEEEDPLVKFSALRALVTLEAQVPVSELSAVLADPMLCSAGFSLLGHVDDDSAVACLLKGLTGSSRTGREAAMDALLRVLSRTDDAEAENLIAQIRDCALASSSLLPRIISRLPEADLPTRLTLVQFLGLVGAPECVTAILEAGRDEAISEVAQATLEALGQVAEQSIDEAWDSLDVQLRKDGCKLLGRTDGERGAARLLIALDSSDTELRTVAAASLGRRRHGPALAPLFRRLEIAAQDDDYEIEEERCALIDALVSLADADADADADGGSGEAMVEEVVELLFAHLEGAVEEVRLAIATVLGRVGRPEEVEFVTSLLKDPSARVRRAAVEALARLDPATAGEPLRLALADESPLVRIAAAGALATSHLPEVVADLEYLVDDDDWRVRAASMRAIGASCASTPDTDVQDRALGLIERGLDDEGAVSVAAVQALGEIGGQGAALLATRLLERQEPELVQAAVDCIGRHGDADRLLELLPLVSHESWAVRAEVVQTLADRRVAQALPRILRRLETEQDAFVRDAILRGLKKLEA